MKQFIDIIRAKQDLTFSESKEAFKILMEGKALPSINILKASLLSEKVKSCFALIMSMNCFICF